MDLQIPPQLIEFLTVFLTLAGVSLVLAVALSIWMLSRIKPIQLPENADWIVAMRITPLVVVITLDLLDFALEAGVNLIDTADIYGRGAAEAMLGRILGKRRGKVLLATKCPVWLVKERADWERLLRDLLRLIEQGVRAVEKALRP